MKVRFQRFVMALGMAVLLAVSLFWWFDIGSARSTAKAALAWSGVESQPLAAEANLGKIEGLIRDNDTGNALFANLYFTSTVNPLTTFSASSGWNGRYAIDLPVGSYTMTVQALEGNFLHYQMVVTINQNQTTTANVMLLPDDGVNVAPQLFGASPTQIVVGEPYHFQPAALDEDGDALTYSIQNKPSWANFNSQSGLLSGTPNQTGTTLGIVISANDGQTSGSLPAFDLEVTANDAARNHPPSLTFLQGPPKVDVGELYYFDPEGTDPDGDPLTYAIENKPSWATFDPQTGILQGTPGAGDVGVTQPLVIRVSDTTNLALNALQAEFESAATQPFQIEVNDPALPYSPSSFTFCTTASAGDDIFANQGITLKDSAAESFTGAKTSFRAYSTSAAGNSDRVIVFRPRNLGLALGINQGSFVLTSTVQVYTVPVTIIVGGACDTATPGAVTDTPSILWGNPKKVAFSAQLGSNVAEITQTVEVNSTGVRLKWNAVSDQSWVLLSPQSGTTFVDPGLTIGVSLAYFNQHTLGGRQTAKVILTDQNNRSVALDVVVNIDPAAAAAPPPANLTCNDSGTVQLTALEVTQGIQNLNNEMPLVSGRRTYVRAHVRSTTGSAIPNFTAKLFNPNGGAIPEIAAGVEGIVPGSITVLPNPDRKALGDSLFFELPAAWVKGNSLTVQLRPGGGGAIRCDEVLSAVDTSKDGTITLPLVSVPLLPIQLYKGINGAVEATDAHMELVRKQALDYLPIAGLRELGPVQTLPFSRTVSVSQEWSKGSPKFEAFQMLKQLRGNAKAVYALVLPGYKGGTAISGGNDMVLLEGDWWGVAQEFEHLFTFAGTTTGLPHADPSAGTESGYFEFPAYVRAGRISEFTDPGDPRSYYALRKYYKSCPYGADAPDWVCAKYNKMLIDIIPPTGSDTLYRSGGDKFPSAWAYKLMMDQLIAGKFVAPAQVSSTGDRNTPATLVSGVLTGTTAGGTAAGAIWDAQGLLVAAYTPPVTGTFALRLESSGGQVIDTIPFTPDDHTAHDEEETGGSSVTFNVLIPYDLNHDTNIAKIVLLHQGTVLGQLNASAEAPGISGMILDESGDAIAGQSVVYDDEPLHYRLEYSPDNGATWQVALSGDNIVPVSGEASFEFAFDKANLPGSTAQKWRMFVSDGFYTSLFESDTNFTIANKPPSAFMQLSVDETAVTGEQRLNLVGSAQDPEDGELTGESITWYSDRDGKLGTGATLSLRAADLSEGAHTFWLEAVDSQGLSSIISGTADLGLEQPVSAQHNDPPLVGAGDAGVVTFAQVQVSRNEFFRAPALAVEGSPSLVIEVGATASLTLPVRNGGSGGTLDWSLDTTTAPSWMSFSRTSGQTPDEVKVTINAAALATGAYTGTLLFKSNTAVEGAMLGVDYHVEVIPAAEPEESSIFMPALKKEE